MHRIFLMQKQRNQTLCIFDLHKPHKRDLHERDCVAHRYDDVNDK